MVVDPDVDGYTTVKPWITGK